MKKLLLSTLIALISMGSGAKAVQVDFSKDSVEELFDDVAGALPMVSQGMMLLPANIETRALPVKAGKKYKLQITAQIDGDFVVEENDRAHIETLQSHLQRLSSTYRVSFQDESGESVPAFGGRARTVNGKTRRSDVWVGGFFLTKNPYPYVLIFYAPENAASLRVSFQSNGRTAYISDLKLVEETEEETVNIAPDFRYGELNYNGWKPSRDGRLYKQPDGRSVLNTGYANGSSFFPLSPEKKYHVSVTGEGGRLNIEYLDKDGKSLAVRFLIRPTPEGDETEFTPPEGTVIGRLGTVKAALLREVRIVEVK